MTVRASQVVASIIAIFLSAPVMVHGASCCLRSTPLESLSDGIQLQSLLITNRQEENKEFWFLPDAPNLVLNNAKRQLIKDLLSVVKQRNSLDLMTETNTIRLMKVVMKTVVIDACNLASHMLNYSLDCTHLTEVDEIARKLDFYETVRRMSIHFNNPRSPILTTGSATNRYAYWNEHVQNDCTPCTCPKLKEIEKKVIRFATNSHICSCT